MIIFLYFSLGINCPKNYNTSDFIISQITVRSPSVEGSEKDKERVHNLIVSFRKSKIYEKLKNELNEASQNQVIC